MMLVINMPGIMSVKPDKQFLKNYQAQIWHIAVCHIIPVPDAYTKSVAHHQMASLYIFLLDRIDILHRYLIKQN